MKKFLILILVLGISTAANATVLSWVDSEGSALSSISVTVGESVTAYLSANDALTYSPKWMDGTDAKVSISNITATANAGTGAAIQNPTQTGYAGFWTVEAAHDGAPPSSVLAGIQWVVDIYGDAVGTGSVFADYYGSNLELSVTVNDVPEPMTIALLGLGGLFLRRRK